MGYVGVCDSLEVDASRLRADCVEGGGKVALVEDSLRESCEGEVSREASYGKLMGCVIEYSRVL